MSKLDSLGVHLSDNLGRLNEALHASEIDHEQWRSMFDTFCESWTVFEKLAGKTVDDVRREYISEALDGPQDRPDRPDRFAQDNPAVVEETPLKEHEGFRVGDRVIFGRASGRKTRGVIKKVNAKSVKVETVEASGKHGQVAAGVVYRVHPSLVTLCKRPKVVR